MPLDLSAPRSLLPFPPLVAASDDSAAPPAPQQPSTGRPAIALKLTEHVLAQVQALLRSLPRGTQLDKGAIRIDLGVNPCLIINSTSYPLRLDAEASHHSILRQRPQRPPAEHEHQGQLEPIATVQHKATVKPGSEGLEKVGHSLRENRELVEREREGRRAVLLDSAPHSRSSSLSRSLSTSTAKRAPSPSTGTGISRPSSAPPRPPSRLTAVPIKPSPSSSATARIPPAVKAPTSSFRIGKGTVPASLSRGGSRSTSPSRSGSAGSAAESPVLPPPPPSTAPTAKITSPAAESASPADSSVSTGSSSHVQSSSTGRTSLSSAGGGSPKGGKELALVVEEKAATKEKEKKEQGSAPAKAGGGGVMKGQESLKKEKKSVGSASEKEKKVRASPSPTKKDSSALPSTSTSSKKPSPPVSAALAKSASLSSSLSKRPPLSSSSADAPPDANKKKRKLLNNVEPSSSASASERLPSPAPSALREASKAPTPISSPRISSLPSIKKKSGAGLARKEKERTGEKRKKRSGEKVRAERWYSSSSDDDEGEDVDAEGEVEDDAEGEADLTLDLNPSLSREAEADLRRASKRRRTVSAPDGGTSLPLPLDPNRGRAPLRLPAHLQPDAATSNRSKTASPLRSSSLAPPLSPPAHAPAPPLSDYAKAYKTYTSLHHLLMEEKAALERGEEGEWSKEEVSRMVLRCEALRRGLEEMVVNKVKGGSR